MQFIRAFMSHGHFGASLDPLNLNEQIGNISETQYSHVSNAQKRLHDYRSYGFTEQDLERTFFVDLPQLGGIFGQNKVWKLLRIWLEHF